MTENENKLRKPKALASDSRTALPMSLGIEAELQDPRFILPNSPWDVLLPFPVFIPAEQMAHIKARYPTCNADGSWQMVPSQDHYGFWEIRRREDLTPRQKGCYRRYPEDMYREHVNYDSLGHCDNCEKRECDCDEGSDWSSVDSEEKERRKYDNCCDTYVESDEGDIYDPLVMSDNEAEDGGMGWQAEDKYGMRWTG